jgi:tetratricopeptide (TPR) repeat protein
MGAAARRLARIRGSDILALIFVWAVALASPPAVRAGSDAATRFFEKRVLDDPDDFVAWNKLGERLLQQFKSTFDDALLRRARDCGEKSLAAVSAGQNPGGLALKARVQLAFHEFAAARESAVHLKRIVPGKSLPLQILGDALVELGEYEEARRAYDEMRAIEGSTVNTEARLARLAFIHGDRKAAKEHLASALAEAKELSEASPETVAWCEVQLGELAFGEGDWDGADAHYAAALASRPDDYSALEHLAELRGAQGRTDEATAMYDALIARMPRPDVVQAAGDFRVFAGKTDAGARLLQQALDAYRASMERGEIHYLHHLAGCYADSLNESAKAVECARKDFASRQSVQACDALAWALYNNGEIAEAGQLAPRALRTGIKDAHILFHVGMIRFAAGDLAGGRAALRDAVAVNPRHNAFHAHR